MPAKLTNGTFCALPFIEKFQHLDGQQYFCCYSKIPIDDIASKDSDELREKIWNGEKIPHCARCYQQDSNKVISPRLLESVRWMKNPEVKDYVTNWQPGDRPNIFYYDLRFDNKCNLACISCNPKDSSLWAKELNVTVPRFDTVIDIDQCIQAKKVYLAGGEPLIIEQFIDLIERIAESDTQPELVINTNLTTISDRVNASLQKIKNLTMVVSVDAYESVNEYHRWPLKWEKFLKNLTWLREEVKCTIQFNTVVDAVSIINLAELVNIEDFADMWNLSILIHPAALSINNLPEAHKAQVLENFVKIKQSKFYSKDPTFKTRVDSAITAVNTVGDPTALSQYIAEIDQRRNLDHQQYLKIKLT